MTRGAEAVSDKSRENLDTPRRFEDEQEREASLAQRAIEAVNLFFGSPAYFIGVGHLRFCGSPSMDLGGRADGPTWRIRPISGCRTS